MGSADGCRSRGRAPRRASRIGQYFGLSRYSPLVCEFRIKPLSLSCVDRALHLLHRALGILRREGAKPGDSAWDGARCRSQAVVGEGRNLAGGIGIEHLHAGRCQRQQMHRDIVGIHDPQAARHRYPSGRCRAGFPARPSAAAGEDRDRRNCFWSAPGWRPCARETPRFFGRDPAHRCSSRCLGKA